MGNSFIKKNYEDSPWLVTRRTGNLLRLWAEVFHVAPTGSGTVKWQQVSDDLVPVSLTCVQDSPTYIFHVTAYTAHVDKVLDVRINQPGTRIGQASECFVYWKDTTSGDTWGLNFTSPMDARQFREVCSPSFKFSRSKNGSTYSLKDKKQKDKKRKKSSVSTPTSPSSQKREPQCTCMTNEHYARLKNQNAAAIKGSSTLQRSVQGTNSGRSTPASHYNYDLSVASSVAAPNSSNVASKAATGARAIGTGRSQHNLSAQYSSMRASASQVPSTGMTQRPASALPSVAYNSGRGSGRGQARQKSAVEHKQSSLGSDHTRSLSSRGRRGMLLATAAVRSVDLTDAEMARQMRCHSSDDLNDASTQIHRVPTTSASNRLAREERNVDSPVTSPDIPRRHGPQAGHPLSSGVNELRRHDGYMSEPETRRRSRHSGFQHESPASENYRFDNLCYATTPSSSNSDFEMNATETEPNSPTYTRLLLEYERHLRNALARGDDAESYSLHTFEAMLSQSNDSLGGGATSYHRTLPNRSTSGRFDQRHQHANGVYQLHSIDPTGQHQLLAYNRGQEMQHTRNVVKRNKSFNQQVGAPFDRNANGTGDRQNRYSGNQSLAHLQMCYKNSPSDTRSGTLKSFESSADPKMCYLTSSEMSDDERISLATMVTDEDEEEQSRPIPNSFVMSQAIVDPSTAFNCTGAVRKAGFLSVKKWLLRKKNQIELAKKRGWRGYWVCLKGTTLLFYPCESCDGRSIEQSPKHLIIVDGAVMQSIPEHPKKENVFCLSTAFGDAYLFQSPCQSEMEGWINSIHCACAAAFARHRGKAGALHMLQEEIIRQERNLEMEANTARMSLMKINSASDIERKSELNADLCCHEETMERLQCEQFRLRCYMASLQGGELPNPKGLLANVSRSTKLILNRLGVFTVSSLHAYISARCPSLLTNLLSQRDANTRRAPMLSRCSSGADSSRSSDPESCSDSQRNYKIRFLGNQFVTGQLKEAMTVEMFLLSVCQKKNVDPASHFLRVKKRSDSSAANFYVPNRSDLIENYLQTHEVCEVCAKVLFQVELTRSSVDQMWGFSVEAELVQDVQKQDELCCYISRVEEISLAGKNGLIHGDEIMVLNGAIVSDLDMMFIESVLQEEVALCLMMRSSRTEVPEAGNLRRSTDEIIESLVCPPPPLENAAQDSDFSSMIVPSVQHWKKQSSEEKGCPPPPSDISDKSNISSVEIDNLLKSATQVTGFCRSSLDGRRSVSPTSSVASSQSQMPLAGKQLTDADKLRKVLSELLLTERAYVKHLNSMIEIYLEPMTREAFISPAELSAVFGNIPKIFQFQQEFLGSLEEAIEMEPNLQRLEFPTQFKNVLFSIGNAFLYHNNSFKLYSSFCASHARAQKLLTPNESNAQLLHFLQRQNPDQQHSCTLESYLIKPIQRILKYPLLLQQLKNLSDQQSGERHHLEEALKGMEKVAEHINEMQRIHEEYGAIFDHLSRQHQKTSTQLLPGASLIELSPGDLLFCGRVEWANISEFLGKVKKGLELHTMCFVFKTAVVFLCKERLRQRKKLMSTSVKSSLAEVEIIRYQSLIPVTEVQVRATSNRDCDNRLFWELIHLKSQIHRRNEKVYHLSNSSPEVRNAFLKTIRQIIRESVRNMSVPMHKTTGGYYRTGTMNLNRGSNTRRKGPSYGTLHRHSIVTSTAHRTLLMDNNCLESGHLLDSKYHRNSTTMACDLAITRFSQSQDTSGSVSSVTSSQSLMRTSTPSAGPSGKAAAPPADDGSDMRDDTSRSEADEEAAAVTTSVSTTASSNTTAAAVKDVSFGQLGGSGRQLSRQLSVTDEYDLALSNTVQRHSEAGLARLVLASNDPEHFQPQPVETGGSPVWKPRDFSSATVSRGTHNRTSNQTASFSTSTLPTSANGASRISRAKREVLTSSCTLPRQPPSDPYSKRIK